MYYRFWTQLPGPFALRVTLVSLAVVAVVTLLMIVVFPAVEWLLPASEVAFR